MLQNTEPLSAHVQLNEDDMAALSAYYYKHTPSGRRRDRILKAAPVVVAVVWAYVARDHPEWGMQEPGKYWLYVGLGTPIILLLSWAMLWYLRPSMARMSVRMGPRKRMLEPLTITLLPGHVELMNADGRGKVPWASVRHVGSTGEHVFLLFAGPNGFIVPRRSFESDAAFEAYAGEAKRLKERT